MIEMYQRQPDSTSFLTERSNLRRNIAVQPICEKFGEKCTSAISMLSQKVICQGDLLAGAGTGASRYS